MPLTLNKYEYMLLNTVVLTTELSEDGYKIIYNKYVLGMF
jgi:hypothetical protein